MARNLHTTLAVAQRCLSEFNSRIEGLEHFKDYPAEIVAYDDLLNEFNRLDIVEWKGEIRCFDYAILLSLPPDNEIMDEGLSLVSNYVGSITDEVCVKFGLTAGTNAHGANPLFAYITFSSKPDAPKCHVSERLSRSNDKVGNGSRTERAREAYLIGENGEADDWPELEKLSHDESPSTRRMVASSLGKLAKKLGLSHDGAIQTLCRLAIDDDAPQVNRYGLKSLGLYDFKTPEILDRIKIVAEDSSRKRYVREAAAELLGKRLPGSVYRENLDKDMTLTFGRALDVSWKIIHGMDKNRQDEIYASLDRGKAILVSEEQCAGYMAWFAKKHMAKFDAAFSLLPSEICDNVIDLFDWGSGIGLAAVAFRDWYDRHFPDRKYGKKVRRITLIEPSNVAIEWATYNATRCFPEAKVIPARKKFSELGSRDFPSVDNPTQCRIHVFSNVLDMRGVNERESINDLANTVKENALGWDDVVVLISPDYGGVDSAFTSFISALRTGTCYDFKEILETQRFSWSREFGDNVDARGVLAVWRIRSQERCATDGRLSPKWRNVYDRLLLDESADARTRKMIDAVHNQLKTIPDADIGFRYRPNLYGTVPEMVVFRKGYLPVFISVGGDGCTDDEVPDAPSKRFMSSAETVQRELCKNNKTLFQLKSAFGLMTTLAYNPVGDVFGCYKESTRGVDGKSHTVYEWRNQIPWKDVRTDEGRKAREAIKRLLVTRRANENVGEIVWDAKQRRLTLSRQGAQKIAGCFGSGKTTVLVERAINAFRRTHSPVLILTYNISLRNHIESALGKRMDANWSNKDFVILNIHQFIRTHGLPFVSGENNVMRFLADGDYALNSLLKCKKSVKRFKAILVDECQDYEYTWLEILKRVYLSDNGEYVLFGDEKQNVYGRQLDGKQVRTNVPGGWNVLDKCHRSAGRLLDFILGFQLLMPKYDSDVVERVFALDDSTVHYTKLCGVACETIVGAMMERIRALGVDPGAVAVLSESHGFLRTIESEYRRVSGYSTEMMVWSVEQIADGEFRKNRDERDLKLFFDGDQTERMKFSTIESFKGFESQCVFLMVENNISRGAECVLEILYTGMTRARQHLEIINVGNQGVDDLFKHMLLENA